MDNSIELFIIFEVILALCGVKSSPNTPARHALIIGSILYTARETLVCSHQSQKLRAILVNIHAPKPSPRPRAKFEYGSIKMFNT